MPRTADAAADLKRYSRLVSDGKAGQYHFVLLLGLRTFDWPTLLRSVDDGLPFSVFEHLRANSALPEATLLDWLQIARRTADRRQEQGRFAPDESDRILRVARVLGKAVELFEGDRTRAVEWLFTSQTAFGGGVPAEIARTELGAREVENLIGRIEHGVYS